MDRLFQSFTQMDASMTRRYGGTGLGLAISRRLTDMMGGRMWAESDGVPGQGSTFHFTIQAEAAPSPPRPYLQGIQSDLSGKRGAHRGRQRHQPADSDATDRGLGDAPPGYRFTARSAGLDPPG